LISSWNLVEELQQLWKGVWAIDVAEGKGFKLRVVVLGAYMIIQH
jgi:hypothetical protein